MENNSRNIDPNGENEKQRETDAKELIRKHIEDPNHEITDEDIRNVKFTDNGHPPLVGAEALSRLEEHDEADIDEDENKMNESVSDSAGEDEEKPITPWDITNE